MSENLLDMNEAYIRIRLHPETTAHRLETQAAKRMKGPNLMSPEILAIEQRIIQTLLDAAEIFRDWLVRDAYYDRCFSCHGHGMDIYGTHDWPKVVCMDGQARKLCPKCHGGKLWEAAT